jgi:hypothetical protein
MLTFIKFLGGGFMRLRHFFILGLILLLFLSYCPSTHAYLQKVYFDVNTMNFNDRKELRVWLSVNDTNSKNPPDIVKSITITAPDNTVFTMNTANNWLPYDRGYYGNYSPEEFNSGDIPSGNYTVRVEGIEFNLAITDSDYNDASVLTPAAFTNLSNEQTGIPKDYIFYWTPVAGATHYRVQLWDENWNEPVYWYWDRPFMTNHAACMFSEGDLRPNRRYRIRIEARSESQDLDKRSRSDWVYFTTGSW